MVVVGGITPSSQGQNDFPAFMYDTTRRQWTPLSLPSKDMIYRQEAGVSVTSNGQAYVSLCFGHRHEENGVLKP